MRGFVQVLNALINKVYYIDDGVQDDGSTKINGRLDKVKATGQRFLPEVKDQLHNS